MDEAIKLRTAAEILDGIVPGHEFIYLGGVAYPAREPDFIRSSKIMALQGQQSDLQNDKKLSDTERMVRLNEIMSQVVRSFSAEIETDWEKIASTATMEEVLSALEIIGLIVNRPFLKRTLAVASSPNRKSRRATSKK